MKTYTVKDLMVPLSEYATISEDATLYEAVLALDKAQKNFDQSKYRHRAILVYDKEKNIIGKVTQLDILRSLEPKYEDMQSGEGITRFGFSKKFMEYIMDQFSLFEKPMDDVCRQAGSQDVKKFMRTPSEGEYIDEKESLDKAIHMLVLGHHQSLLVTRGEKIVGLLRLTDVFYTIFQAMKTCGLDE